MKTINKKFSLISVTSILLFLGMILLGQSNHASAAPKGSGSATIALNQSDPHLGDAVDFTVTIPKLPGNIKVRIQVLAYQNGDLTYGEAGPYDQAFLLGGGSSIWKEQGGPASCVATLYHWSYTGGIQKFNELASTSFEAGGVR